MPRLAFILQKSVYLQDMKRVLIITYYWPPTGGSGVQRWVKFSKYLPEHGWQPVVYTPLNPEQLAVDTTLEAEVPSEAEIIRTRIIEPYNLYKNLLRRSGHSKEAVEVNPVNAKEKSPVQKFAMWIRGNLFRPDPRCLWISPSVRYLKKYLKDHPVDLIVTTGPPQSMHMIGRRLSKETGLPWIADFRDPWTRIFYFKHLSMTEATKKWHRKMEKKVLDDATAVVAVSPMVQKDFQEMTSTPVHLITNGFDESDFNVETEPDDHFNVTHTGLLVKDGNPVELWNALGRKCREDKEFGQRFRLVLVGKSDKDVIDSIEAAGIGGNLVNLGYRSHGTAVRCQKSASMLILPIREEPETKAILPGKLFEYLAAGKPVLGIGTREGAMAQVLEETGNGKIYDWDDRKDIADFIDRCWEKFRNGESEDFTAGIHEYSRKALTEKMVALFESLI